ncbi:hypothetical protein BS78_01G104900 [Paspalum vaginatum]|nr:hypothetical protein BS78_01G104900 [Paspalum vaginatum]
MQAWYVSKNTLSNGNSPQQINIDDDDDDTDCTRTEKRLLWKKEEDFRLVGAWLNNSNDPIGSNYKKNDQYCKDVAAVYNSTTPKSRARPVKNRWSIHVLRKEPKWDAYLERLQELEPDKRNFSTCEDVGQHFSLNATADERRIGGKQAKERLKRKRKDQACIIDLEGELNKFVDA